MASNIIPKYYNPLIELLEDAADGALTHGATIGLLQNTDVAIRSNLNQLVGTPAGPGGQPPATDGFKANWNKAKAAKTAAGAAFRSAKSNGRALAKACVNVLKPRLGDSWTNAWQNAGFTGGSIAIPDNPLTLLQQLRAYFVTNPAHEKTDLGNGLEATAAACEAMVQALSDASSASNASNVAAGAAKAALEAGIAAARTRLTGLREELGQLIADDDPRWYAFGFERPSDPETPEVPENITFVHGGGLSFVDFDDARRAETYRVRVTNNATHVQLDEKLTEESEATFTGLPANTDLLIEVTAINAAGESQPGTLLTIFQ